jgi:hypothetical protein
MSDRVPLRPPCWRCQAVHYWPQFADVYVCTRLRWHWGHHYEQHWRMVRGGWTLPGAVVGPKAGAVRR